MKDPRLGEFNGQGTVGSPVCGDIMKIWIKIDPRTKRIKKCTWRTFGCASAIASTSMLSVMVTRQGGMKIDQAMKLTPKDILNELGGLPTRKVHCSVLGDQALRAAIADYQKNKKFMPNTKQQINKILNEVRPGIQMDGGDVALKSFKDGVATLKIKGACVGCPMAQMTFNAGIGEMLKEKIPAVKETRYE